MSDEHDRLICRRAKVMMRRRFRGHRSALPSGATARRSEALCERLLTLPELLDATDIALFWCMEQRNEVNLSLLDHALRERGASLYYPRTHGDSGMLSFHRLRSPDELVDGPFGTQEPPADAPEPEGLDLVVVPGLAFDGAGYRIGYGGGFYDRTLPRWCPPAHAIGVAFDFQLAAEVPRESFDVPVDAVVTDARILRVERIKEGTE